MDLHPTYPRRTIPTIGDKPPWLRVRLPGEGRYFELKRLVREEGLHTICEEARCPNMAECWSNGTATLLLLGDVCTRACGFCAVASGRPGAVDAEEPSRVARTVRALGLRHAVLTSVTRDDLADGGAGIFAESIREIREQVPSCAVEVLIPDFGGNWGALATVMEASPDVLNHNVETIPRLYGIVRPKAVYSRSLELLRRAKDAGTAALTKSGLMVGLGEREDELLAVLEDLRQSQVDVVTIGQYLRPSARHIPVVRYYTPAEFDSLKQAAREIGLPHVESGPLVRSSYHAHEALHRSLD